MKTSTTALCQILLFIHSLPLVSGNQGTFFFIEGRNMISASMHTYTYTPLSYSRTPLFFNVIVMEMNKKHEMSRLVC